MRRQDLALHPSSILKDLPQGLQRVRSRCNSFQMLMHLCISIEKLKKEHLALERSWSRALKLQLMWVLLFSSLKLSCCVLIIVVTDIDSFSFLATKVVWLYTSSSRICRDTPGLPWETWDLALLYTRSYCSSPTGSYDVRRSDAGTIFQE